MHHIDFGHIDHMEKKLDNSDTSLSKQASLNFLTELTGLTYAHDGKVKTFRDCHGGIDFIIKNEDGSQTEIDFTKAGQLYAANLIRPIYDQSFDY